VKNSTLKKSLRLTEFILLFFGVPLFIYFDPGMKYPSSIVIPILIGIFIFLRRVPDFKFKDLVTLKLSKDQWRTHGIIVILTSVVLLLAVYFFDRENLFNLPKASMLMWIMMCIFYPIFSAFGQEIIYRTFLFYRYRLIFRTDLLFVIASSISFSFVHIVYYSHISIILTLLLGLYLAVGFLKTKSVLFTSILHGFFGNLIFTIGLGTYFWLDMTKWMETGPVF
jgi:hypothetical protein